MEGAVTGSVDVVRFGLDGFGCWLWPRRAASTRQVSPTCPRRFGPEHDVVQGRSGTVAAAWLAYVTRRGRPTSAPRRWTLSAAMPPRRPGSCRTRSGCSSFPYRAPGLSAVDDVRRGGQRRAPGTEARAGTLFGIRLLLRRRVDGWLSMLGNDYTMG